MIFGHEIACEIKRNIPDARLACITSGLKKYEEFHRTQTEINYEFIRNCDLYDLGVTHPLSSPQLRVIEEDLGVNSIWEMVQIDRIINMDPGRKYWYDYRKQMTNDQICSLIRHLYKFIKRIEKEFFPDVIVGPNLLHLAHIMIYHYFTRRGTKYIMISGTYIKEHSVLDYSWDNSIPEIRDLYQRLLSDPDWTPSAFSKQYIKGFRKKHIKPEAPEIAYSRTLFKLSDFVLRIHRGFHLYRFLEMKKKLWSPFEYFNSIDNYSFKQYIMIYFLSNYNRYISKRMPYVNTSNLPESFVFMLLQVDPENSTMLWAPHYANQIEIARQIAMSLPGDFRLIVKEHPWMVGKRRKRYYEKLLAVPNIDLITPEIDSYSVMKKAKLVVTISGTAAFEMALLGKRSLIFSNMVYSVLPHIARETDFKKLPEVLANLLWDDKDVHYEWDLQLAAYLDSVRELGFEVAYGERWEGGETDIDITALTDCIVSKLRTIQDISA